MRAAELAPGQGLPGLTVVITEEMIRRYADASGDHNPLHLDADVARAAGLGGVIAHGMLQFGLLSSAVTAWAGEAAKVRRIGVRFAAMVRPRDTVSVTGTVAATEEGRTRIDASVVNQHGEAVLTRVTVEVDG